MLEIPNRKLNFVTNMVLQGNQCVHLEWLLFDPQKEVSPLVSVLILSRHSTLFEETQDRNYSEMMPFNEDAKKTIKKKGHDF